MTKNVVQNDPLAKGAERSRSISVRVSVTVRL
jgi:hypothetical protein